MNQHLLPPRLAIPWGQILKRQAHMQPTRAALVGSVSTGFLGQGVLVLSGVLLARLLGVEGRGYQSLLTLFPVVLSQLGGLGLPVALTYYIARDRERAAATVCGVASLAIVQVAILAVGHAGILVFVLKDAPDAVRLGGLITLGAVPAILVHQYGLAVLQGQQCFRLFNVLRVLPAILYSAFVLVIFLVGGGNLPQVMLAWVLSTAIVCSVTLTKAVRSLPKRVPGNPAASRREMLGFGLKGLLGSVSPVDTFRLDQAVVGLFLSPTALGLYVTGVVFTNLPRFIAQSIGMVAYPNVAARPEPVAARRALWRFFWLSVGLCALIVAALEASAGWLVPFFFGVEFAKAVPVTRVLLLSAFFLSARRVLTDGVRGKGQPTLGTLAEASSWVVLLPSIGLLAPRWGVEGVALAMVLSSVVSLLVLIGLVAVRSSADRVKNDTVAEEGHEYA